MPFKLKLKKSRQYNVTSKSLFIISVYHLLDTSTAVDCTLSSESTGQECLENVCLRLSIYQSEFFGLRFIVKGTGDDEHRWIDLERPLSRQLEKYAAKTILFLRVMYYVSPSANLVTDEQTRSYFYLQLKSDLVDGRLNCDPKQAVTLASYCLHAEYDSQQKEKYNVDYLKTLLPFPKHMVDAGLLEVLTQEVLNQNFDYQNLTQNYAEEQFISTCEQIDGFMQEKFNAKNQLGTDVTIGITFFGIAIWDEIYTFFEWRDITNIVNHKRCFNIECTNPEKSIGFVLVDTDTARYVWKLSVLQHTMHRKCDMKHLNSSATPENIKNSRENLFSDRKSSNWTLASETHQSNSQHQSQYLWSDNSASEQSIMASNLMLAQAQRNPEMLYGSPTVFDSTTSITNQLHNWNLNRNGGSNISLNNHQPDQSTSCLDLSNNNIYQESEGRKTMLPLYRPAPDYETAVQQKYRASVGELRLSTPLIKVSAEMISDPHLNIYGYESQNDIHKLGTHARPIYPDVTQTANPIFTQNHYNNAEGQKFRLMKLSKPPPPPYPVSRVSSTSTPDLAVASQRAAFGYRGVYVSGSSPDLVSTRNLGRHMKSNPLLFHKAHFSVENRPLGQSHGYIPPHGTIEHLNVVDHPNYNQKQLIHNGNNIIYCMPPRNVDPFVNKEPKAPNDVAPNTTSTVNHLKKENLVNHHAVEPIYENVPFSWSNDNSKESAAGRNRTSSIQSAPGVMKNGDKMFKPNTSIGNGEQIPLERNNALSNMYRATPSNSQQLFHTQPKQSPQHDIEKPSSGQTLVHNTSSVSVTSRQDENKNKNNSTNELFPKTPLLRVSTSTPDTSHSSSAMSLADTTYSPGSGEIKSEKRKKRWGILSRAKLGGSKSSDKQKSATLGREKDKSKKNSSSTFGGHDENTLRHRWSTGLPKAQSLPADISKEKMCQILDAKLTDEQLYLEFEQIPKRKENTRFDCALQEENKNLNFDPDFLPYDDNRVKIIPTRDNRLGYVNASHITTTVGTKQRFYIVAQSPRNSLTCDIFWKCVWEADVYLIIQLSNDLMYVPSTNEHHLDYGQYQVWREFSQETDQCITSKLRLYHTQNRRYRSVWHLSYLEWNDQNCPKNVVHFLDFLEEFNSVRIASITEVPPGHNTNPPVLIHCSSGDGRAGVTLASDLLLYTLDHNQALNIPETVKKLCEQRDKIIPSLSQYKFIYALLIHYLRRNRLI